MESPGKIKKRSLFPDVKNKTKHPLINRQNLINMESTVFLLTNPDGIAIPRQDIPSALKALTHMTLVSLVWCPNNCLARVSQVIPKSKARFPRTGKQG